LNQTESLYHQQNLPVKSLKLVKEIGQKTRMLQELPPLED
jgi:hypothetical protein